MARPEVESGVAQPDALPFLRFHLDGVQVLEGGAAIVLSPPAIIPAGNTFTIRTQLGFEGGLAGLLLGLPFDVHHHWERIEDGVTGTLPVIPPAPSFVVPPPPAANLLTVVTGPYTTSSDGTGHLDRPAGPPIEFASFRITTHILPGAGFPIIATTIAAFHDGLIIMVT